jgi:hypothetical protein
MMMVRWKEVRERKSTKSMGEIVELMGDETFVERSSLNETSRVNFDRSLGKVGRWP